METGSFYAAFLLRGVDLHTYWPDLCIIGFMHQFDTELSFSCYKICRMREDMSTVVCVKEEEDPGEKLSQDEIISRTKQVIQGLEALKQEHHSILEGLLGTLCCLKQDDEGVLVEEKSHMIRKSLEMLELGLSEAQVCVYRVPESDDHWWIVIWILAWTWVWLWTIKT